MTDIELSDEELSIVRRVAKKHDLTEIEAAQMIFLQGVESILSDVSPTTMTIERIRRASK